jgi:hypothetical protein
MTTQQKEILELSGFKCAKCGFYSPLGEGLEVNKDFNVVLCQVCNTFAPNEKNNFDKYIAEKIEWQTLETFRNSNVNKSSHDVHKRGMIEGAKKGKLMARPPFGYKVIEGKLIVDEQNSQNVRLIFEDFANGKSLNQLSMQYGISVNGIKKILKNFTYLGKIKFNNEIIQGNHQPLISAELFNRVQSIIDRQNKNKKAVE